MSTGSQPTSFTIIKLGGAALTNKSIYRKAYPDTIKRFASIIANVLSSGFKNIIVVHGAGSYGHFEAKSARINSTDPKDFEKKTPLGIAATCASLVALNTQVLDAFIAAGVPAVNLPVFPREDYVTSALRALEDGFLPVLHGDVVMDDKLTARVMSGDEIVQNLAAALLMKVPAEAARDQAAVRVVFVTGAPGVFVEAPVPGMPCPMFSRIFIDPRTSHAAPILSERAADVRALLESCEVVKGTITTTVELAGPEAPIKAGDSAETADTTGGIMGKLQAALRLVTKALPEISSELAREGPKVSVHVVGTQLANDQLELLFNGRRSGTGILAVTGTHMLDVTP